MKIDAYGKCVNCNADLITERIVDMRPVKMFLPIKDEVEFLLNDGSRMRVTICTPCKEKLDLKDPKVHQEIMEAVIHGWQLEVDMLVLDEKKPDWDKERAAKHMGVYSQKEIIACSELLAPHIIDDLKRQIVKDNEKMILEAQKTIEEKSIGSDF